MPLPPRMQMQTIASLSRHYQRAAARGSQRTSAEGCWLKTVCECSGYANSVPICPSVPGMCKVF